MKKLLTFIIVVLAVTVMCACGKKQEESREIVVAVAPGFYPITYADDKGEAQGYDVEVFRALDEILPQYTFKYEIADKETMNVGVQSGTYQVGINSIFKNDARLETYLMPENNMGYTMVGLIQREDDNIPDLETAIKDGRLVYPIVATSGIIGVANEWNAAHPDMQINYDTIMEPNYEALFNGIKDADYDYAIDLIPVFNLQPEENVAGLKMSEPIDLIPTFPIINKNETQLCKDIDAGLKTLKDNGKLSELSKQFFEIDLFVMNK